MKIIATFHKTAECEWKIRVLPRKNQDGRYDEELYDVWSPTGKESMLVFNPTISIVIKGRHGDNQVSAMVPIHMVYALEHCLSTVYERLQVKGMYRSEGSSLYIDGNIAGRNATKLSLYRASLVMIPAVVTDRFTGKMLRGVRLSYDGDVIGDLHHAELREICEVLNHLDINSYSMILALAEKLVRMDRKLDTILDGQAMILSILKNQGVGSVNSPANASDTWTPGRF